MSRRYSHLDANVNAQDRITMRSHYDAMSATLIPMAGKKAISPEQRRRTIKLYMRERGHKVLPWTKRAGISESTLRNFLNGDSDSLSDRSYTLLARADGVPVSRLTGSEDHHEVAERAPPQVPVRSFVGAGDEIIIISEDDAPIDWVAAPPGMEESEATVVRGRSGMPLYHDGDLLYHRRLVRDPARFRGEVVVAQVKNGKRYVKLLERGSRKGLFTLVSINPAFPPLEDQQLEWIGPIEWVQKKRRF